MKVGELVYTKNVGFPFNRTDNGNESWEGVSCVVIKTNVGRNEDMVEVKPLFPIKCGNNHTPMTSCIFHVHQVVRENRPWLRRHIRDIMRLKNMFRKVALETQELTK